MSHSIDCLIIGHNEMDFAEVENRVRMIGLNSGMYRDLNYSFIRHDNKVYTVPQIYNAFTDDLDHNSLGPLCFGNSFSAGIAYLGTYLRKRGFTFDFINTFQDEKEELARKLSTEKILTVAIMTTFYTWGFPLLEVLSFVKKHNKTAKIIIGGPYIDNNLAMEEKSWRDLMEVMDADFYSYGTYAEEALVKIISSLKTGLSFESINNLFYKSNQEYIKTPTAVVNVELEDNTVDWNYFSERIGSRMVSIRTSISCPFSCAFCDFPQRSGKYKTITVAALERELDTLHNIQTVKYLGFIDDTFNIPAERFKAVLKMMIRNKYDFKWVSYFRCQFADEEMVALMKESGCIGVFLGIESGNDKMLQNMNKQVTVEQYRKGISIIKKYDIPIQAFFLIGFPGETLDTVNDTIRFIEETQPTFYRLTPWINTPTAPSWNMKDEYNIQGMGYQWSHATMDSQTAADLVEKIFLSVKSSIWLPGYSWDYAGVVSLLNRGFNLEQVKDFIIAFNTGVKEKLLNPEHASISVGTAEQLKKCVKAAYRNGERR